MYIRLFSGFSGKLTTINFIYIQMLKFSKWLINEEVLFQTEQGSVYKFDGTKSVRFKSHHQFHPSVDKGLKNSSVLTVFISPELANEIGMWQTSNATKKRIVLIDNKVIL